MQVKRQGLVVWFQHRKNIKHIKRLGHLIYVSKKLRYAILYVDMTEVEDKKRELEEMPFIFKVELSQKPFISTDYENAKPDEAKLYDYKMGI